MPAYTVYLLTPFYTWEDVEADSPAHAIASCDPVIEPDPDVYHAYLAVPQEQGEATEDD